MANKETRVGKLLVGHYESREQMGAVAAARVVQKIGQLLAQKGELSIVFAAAPSQNEFLHSLSSTAGIDWKRIRAFHMDEYVGLDQKAPQRFGNFLKQRLFDRVDLKEVHYLDGTAPDLKAECRRYADLLTAYPPDIVCLGIGENTHLAFNDPHVADFQDPKSVKLVSLDQECRQQQINDGCFQHLDDVPLQALTLTIPSLLCAAHLFCMVPGSNKSEAVRLTLTENISERFPSTILRRHEDGILFLDRDSAAQLPPHFFLEKSQALEK